MDKVTSSSSKMSNPNEVYRAIFMAENRSGPTICSSLTRTNGHCPGQQNRGRFAREPILCAQATYSSGSSTIRISSGKCQPYHSLTRCVKLLEFLVDVLEQPDSLDDHGVNLVGWESQGVKMEKNFRVSRFLLAGHSELLGFSKFYQFSKETECNHGNKSLWYVNMVTKNLGTVIFDYCYYSFKIKKGLTFILIQLRNL